MLSLARQVKHSGHTSHPVFNLEYPRMSSTTTPLLIPDINFGPTLGAALIGVVFAAVFQGVTILQGIFYYRTYPKDPISLKLLVGVLLTLDTLSLALCTHGVYTYLVIDFDNLLALADSPVVWSIASEPVATAVVVLVVHIFLAYRIRILDHRWWPLSVVIVLVSMFSFSIALTASVLADTAIGSVSALPKLRWSTYAGEISTSAIDLTNTAAITFLLRRNRGRFARTDRMINKITLYVISTGMITSTITVSGMIAYLLAPTNFYFLMIEFSSSKAYTNTILGTLNSRQYISESTPTTVGTVLQFRAAPPSMVSDSVVGAKGGSGSQNVTASLAHDTPDTKESADSLSGESSDRMTFPTDKVSDPTWV